MIAQLFGLGGFVFSVLTEAFNIVSIIIGMIRFDLKKEQNK